MFLDIFGIKKFFYSILVQLAVGLYKIVGGIYNVFLILARTNIFSEEHYKALTEKVYVILAVAMLFIIAYNFLTLIVDPDKDKGGASIQKMLKDIVISFILIVLTPSLFTFAFDVQDSILNQDTIARFFRGGIDDYGADAVKSGGNKMAAWTLRSFFEVLDNTTTTFFVFQSEQDFEGALDGMASEAARTGSYKLPNGDSWGKFTSEYLADENLDFHFLVAVVAGAYLIYVLINFCFDLAVRVVKLAFYQIIAPICIACRIIPKQEGIFTKWWQAVIKTYMAVFIRVFLMNLTVYLITIFIDADMVEKVCSDPDFTCGSFAKLIAKALIILGILTFMRQAPKLIDEIFGLGDVKLGIRDHLKESGALVAGASAGAAIGSGTTAFARNATNAWTRTHHKDASGKWVRNNRIFSKEGIKDTAYGLFNTIGGGISGTIRGAKGGWSAKSIKDMKDAASKGAQATIDARNTREERFSRYQAEHPGKGIIGTMVAGHVSDTVSDIKDWATGGSERYLRQIELTNRITQKWEVVESTGDKLIDKLKNNLAIKNSEMTVKSFKGTPESQQKQFDLYQRTKELSISAMEEYLQNLRDSSPVREDFKKEVFDEAAYSEAVRNAITKGLPEPRRDDKQFTKTIIDEDAYRARQMAHAQEVADFGNMLSQVKKDSRDLMLQKALTNKDNPEVLKDAGLKASDVQNLVQVIGDFDNEFKAQGYVVVNTTKTEDDAERIIGVSQYSAEGKYSSDSIEAMKKVNDAYKDIGTEAKKNAAEARRKAEQRKNEKK